MIYINKADSLRLAQKGVMCGILDNTHMRTQLKQPHIKEEDECMAALWY